MQNIDENTPEVPAEPEVSNPVPEQPSITDEMLESHPRFQAITNKLDELLGEKKAEQSKRLEAEAEARRAEEDKLREEGQWKEIAQRAEERANEAYAKLEAFNREQSSAKIEAAFVEQMSALGVKPEALPLVKSALLSNYEIGPDGRMMTTDGKSMSDHIQEWSTSETAKLVIAAPHNSGGGNLNTGAAPSGGTKGKTLTELSQMKKAGEISEEQFKEALANR